LVVSIKDARILNKIHGNSYIDCIRFANGNIITKSIDNQLHYWNSDTQKKIHSFLVKSGENNSRFDVSLDECFLCIGSDYGAVYVYDIQTSKLLAELHHKKTSKAVRCCAFTRNCG
jgi:WD40 repeat protein